MNIDVEIDTLPDGAPVITSEDIEELVRASSSGEGVGEAAIASVPPTIGDLPTRKHSSFDEEPTRKAHAPKAPRTPVTGENTDVVDVSSWDAFRDGDDSADAE